MPCHTSSFSGKHIVLVIVGVWIEHFSHVELRCDLFNFILGQLESARSKVLLLVGCLLRFRDDAIVSGEAPAQDHLGWRHTVLLGEPSD